MNKPSPLVSKSPFIGQAPEQYTSLWQAILHVASECGYPDYGLSGAAKESRAAESYIRHTDVTHLSVSTVDMLNRLGYKIAKVQE